MPYAEVIFEPGSKSVVQYDNESDLKNSLTEHVRRAKAGEVGGPSGHSAERISKVVLYDDHPADLNANGRVDANNVTTLVSGMTTDDGTIDVAQLVAALRDEASPTYPVDQGRHQSMYKQEGTEFDLGFLDGDES